RNDWLMSSGRLITKQQTSVAVGIEPVTAFDRVGIGLFHGVETGECRYQHEQRRTGQVKIGQENIDCAKPIARRNENGSFAGERLDGSVFLGGAFQQTQR